MLWSFHRKGMECQKRIVKGIDILRTTGKAGECNNRNKKYSLFYVFIHDQQPIKRKKLLSSLAKAFFIL